MKNITWRKVGYALLLVGAGAGSYAIGYSIGAIDSAKWFIEQAVNIGIIDGIGKAELMEYFIKLKGGA